MMNCSNDPSGCKTKCFTKCLKIALLAGVGIAALGWVVMLLWNWLMPALFAGAARVDYLQALGILLLSKILFGGLRGGCHGHWKARQQRWESMTPEEREQLKGRFKSRWASCGAADKGPENTPGNAGNAPSHSE